MGFFSEVFGGQLPRDEKGEEIKRLAMEEVRRLEQRGFGTNERVEHKAVPPGFEPAKPNARPSATTQKSPRLKWGEETV
ncbi:MAG: hypothetical protein AAB460_02280 [Patescibacteria group bacterium]